MTEKMTMKSNRFQKGRLWVAAFLALLCLQILLLVYFGNRKAGFHEDEYYSYYSTNRTAGLFEPDREWVERDSFRNEFVVLEGEGFRYGLVATVQSWDVHPPFFYFLLHTVCSVFPGVFSKWLGIGVNIAAFAIHFALLSWLAYMVGGKDKKLAFAVTAVYGCNAAAVSGVMFIRMYEWLSVFVLLCACLHVRAVLENGGNKKLFLFPLMAVNYLGFLTQYYYIIFLAFMGGGFCLWSLWKNRRWKDCILYGAACGISLLLAVASYPSCLSHIFRGYRGTGAVSEFLDTGNTWDRLGFFAGLVNEYLFNGYLWFWLLLIAVLGCAAVIRWKKTGEEGRIPEDAGQVHIEAVPYFMLLLAAAGYFFTVSKTALLLYETSNRYQLPVYGIFLLLVMAAVYGLWNRGAVFLFYDKAGRGFSGIGKMAGIFCFVLFLAGNIYGLASGKVIFLYEEDRAVMEYAEANEHTPVVIFYNDATPYHVWWRSRELMQYDRVYFASQGNQEKIEDETICGSDKVIVYAADYETQEESLNMIQEANPKLESRKLIAKKGLWSIYELE